MMEIIRVTTLPPSFIELVEEFLVEGHGFVKRTQEEWVSGKNTFSQPGEVFYLAYRAGKIVGCCGINIDPYTTNSQVGRIRHLYVLPSYRRMGIARSLVQKCLTGSSSYFGLIRLRANRRSIDSFKFYEALGFNPTSHDKYETHRIQVGES